MISAKRVQIISFLKWAARTSSTPFDNWMQNACSTSGLGELKGSLIVVIWGGFNFGWLWVGASGWWPPSQPPPGSSVSWQLEGSRLHILTTTTTTTNRQHLDFLSSHANIHHPKNCFPAAEQPGAKNVKDPQKALPAQALLPKLSVWPATSKKRSSNNHSHI